MRKTFLIIAFILSSFNVSAIGQEQKNEQKQIVVNCHSCKIIFQPKPQYPKAARALNVSGQVNVQVLIDENGNVIEAKAISGHPFLHAESVKAALETKFEPKTLSGKPVRMNTVIVYSFNLDKSLQPQEEKDVLSKSIPYVSDVKPKVISMPEPDFPRGGKNVRGAVSVIVTIDEEGNVFEAVAVSGHPLLRPAAEKSAMKAKFEPYSVGGEAIKIRFPIVYNFVPEKVLLLEEEKETQTNISTPIQLGVLNNRAISLPQPVYPKEVLEPGSGGSVNVQITINLQKGSVVSAAAVSGNPLLRKYAEEAALKATFRPVKIEGEPLFAKGVLVCKHPSESEETDNPKVAKGLGVIVGGIINDKATYFPKPEFPKSCRCSGTVKVRIVVNIEGKVIDASAVSGNPLLHISATQAARQTKFAPTNIHGLPVFAVAYLVYNFNSTSR